MTTLLSLLLTCAPTPEPAPSPPGAPDLSLRLPTPVWPAAGAPLTPPVLGALPTLRVYLDPGHGAPDNHGNVGVYCHLEEEFTLALAAAVAARLEDTPITVRLARSGEERPGYRQRVREAEAWGADVYVSLHSDNRGVPWTWEPEEGRTCPRNDHEVGTAVLWSDDGADPEARHALAREVARSLQEAGLPAYSGVDYGTLYGGDEVPGVFVDQRRHVYVLHAPSMPSVLVETHHAWSLAEVERWEEDATVEAFTWALVAGLTAP